MQTQKNRLVSNGPQFSLRTFSIAAAMVGALGACAAPSAEERAKYMDLRYGNACAALVAERDNPKYRECVADAYKADRQRAISQYNESAGKTGLAALLLFR